jgi:hypothetical protein
VQGRTHPLGGEGRLPKAHTGGVKNRIGNGRRAWHRRRQKELDGKPGRRESPKPEAEKEGPKPEEKEEEEEKEVKIDAAKDAPKAATKKEAPKTEEKKEKTVKALT